MAGFTATLGTDGLSLAGTLTVPGAPTGLSISGTFSSLKNYSVSASGTLTGWSPTPGVTIAQGTTISGTLSSTTTPAGQGKPASTATTVDLLASPAEPFSRSRRPAR